MGFGVAFSWRGEFALPGNGVARPTLNTFGGLVKIVADPSFHTNVRATRTNFATVKDHGRIARGFAFRRRDLGRCVRRLRGLQQAETSE